MFFLSKALLCLGLVPSAGRTDAAAAVRIKIWPIFIFYTQNQINIHITPPSLYLFSYLIYVFHLSRASMVILGIVFNTKLVNTKRFLGFRSYSL